MPMGAVNKIRLGAATNSGAPKKPSIPNVKSVKTEAKKKGKAGVGD